MCWLVVKYRSMYIAQDDTTKVATVHYLTTALMWDTLGPVVALLSGLCTRLSICLCLLRIFGIKREWRWGLYTLMVFATVVVIPSIVGLLGQCSPMNKIWDPFVAGNCWPSKLALAIAYFNGGERLLDIVSPSSQT